MHCSNRGAWNGSDGTVLYGTAAGKNVDDPEGIVDIGAEVILGCTETEMGAYDELARLSFIVPDIGVDVELNGAATDAGTSVTTGCMSDRFVS